MINYDIDELLFEEQPELLLMAIKSGLDINSIIIGDQETFFEYCCRMHFLYYINILLDTGNIDVNIPLNDGIALHLLAYDNYMYNNTHHELKFEYYIFQKLVSNTNHIDSQDNDGITPLMLAAKSANPVKVNILLKHGANPNLTDFNGNTSLHYALMELRENKDRFDVLELLIQNKANGHIKNKNNLTPLDYYLIAYPPIVKSPLSKFLE